MAYTTIGIDISDSSIKVLQLSKALEVAAYGQKILQEGVVEQGFIKDKKKFVEELSAVLRNTKPTQLDPETTEIRAALSVPESKLYTHYILMPDSIKKSEERQYIKAEAEKLIPYPFQELYFAYHAVEKDGVRHVTVAAVPKRIVANYAEALLEGSVRPQFIGGRLFSLGRALLPDALGEDNYMIVDIGSRSTDIGIYDIDAIANMAVQIPVAGSDITKALQESLALSKEEADEQKETEGLTKKKSDTYATIESVIDPIMKEIVSARDYFNKTTAGQIEHIILAGGTALLPGLTAYMSEKLDAQIEIGTPYKKIKQTAATGDDTHQIFLANVIGLALYSVNESMPRINLLEQYFAAANDDSALRLTLSDIRTKGDALVWAKYAFLRAAQASKNVLELLRLAQKINIKLLATLIFFVGTFAALIYVMLTYL